MTQKTSLIYILEDDPDVSRVLERVLAGNGYTVVCCPDVLGFTQQLAMQKPDLCIVDLSLPDGDGLSLLKDGRLLHDVAVIVVSGRSGLGDKLLSFESGADDYVVKPIEPLELVARVKCVLRRHRNHENSSNPVETNPYAKFRGWKVYLHSYKLYSPDGQLSVLSHSEISLLQAFFNAPGRILSRDFLIEATNPCYSESIDRSIDVRISRLRRKLAPEIIKTVYGAGYVFAANVEWANE
jgi:two-component system, OmpR family, response regulator